MKSLGGNPKLRTIWLLDGTHQGLTAVSQRGVGLQKIVQMSTVSAGKTELLNISFRITQFLYQKATISSILLRTLTKAALIVGRAKITTFTFIQSQLFNLITNFFIYF